MTEDEAKAWVMTRPDVSRETFDRIESLVAVVLEEASQQNLISASTIPHIWERHIVDSIQLLDHADSPATWIDLGSGAGFPGMVVASIFSTTRITLVESRRKRIDFLARMADQLGITDRVTIAGTRLEMIESQPFDIISARAFAPLDRLLPLAHRFSTAKTSWLLPKGRSSASELEAVRTSWQGSFKIVPSVTDPEAAIIVAQNVQPRGRR